jgi:predicted  nucleic acid-binding Zn-ribbon protein
MNPDRDELKRSEEENARARDSLRVEREKLEFTQVEHQKALDEMREQHHGAERAKTKREEELQRRIRALESDLQVLEHELTAAVPVLLRAGGRAT